METMDLDEVRKYLERIVEQDLIVRMGERGEYVVAVQTALLSAGHELLTDGDFKPVTWVGARHFQAVRGLRHDGQVGPATATAMLEHLDARGDKPIAPSLDSVVKAAPHLSRMRAGSGAEEFAGSADNPLIMFWVDAISMIYPELHGDIAWYDGDDVAWCGLAAGAAAALGIPSFEPPREQLAAASWGEWGQGLSEPMPGAVMVFSREGGNHVAFYESEDESYFYIRGGNQSDMVNVYGRSKSQDDLWAIRWPPGLAIPDWGPVFGVTKMAGT